jgi:hypothetical protein
MTFAPNFLYNSVDCKGKFSSGRGVREKEGKRAGREVAEGIHSI